MLIEGFAFTILLSLGLLRLVLWRWQPRSRAITVTLVLLVIAVASAGAWTSLRFRATPVAEESIDYRPTQVQSDDYVSSDTCRACHPHEYDTWHRSFHRTMTQVPTPETVLGDFDDVELRYLGRNFRLEQRGDEFWVTGPWSQGADVSSRPPRIEERRVALLTGSHHLQVYWCVVGDEGRLVTMPFVYLIQEREWIPLNASFLTPPARFFFEDTSHWPEKCMRCHATHGRPGFEPPDGFDAEVAEFGIACEACHGPGAEHVQANRNPGRRYRLHLGEDRDPTAVQPEYLSDARSSQVCGQCHGVQQFQSDRLEVDWYHNGSTYRPGDELTDTRLIFRVGDLPRDPRLRKLLRLQPDYVRGRFWPDGMVRVTGREYNALIESPCYAHGDESKGILSCVTCHRMHQSEDDPRPADRWTDDQLKPDKRGNQACLPCHGAYEEPAALSAHTHHPPDSPGSDCYNCHMPYTTYGLLKAIRSHQIDSPTVQASQQTGRPNACNQCHLDRTLAWTADNLERWYGTPRPRLTDDERQVAASVLWLLRGDAGQRALMAWSLGWDAAHEASGWEWTPLYLAQLLDDPYEAVRLIAYRSLQGLPGYEELQYEFTAGRRERFSGAMKAVEIWKRQYAQPGDLPTGEPILIGPQRDVRSHVITRLGQQRDDRPLSLQE